MTGRWPGLYWRVTWKVISPLLLLTIFVAYFALLTQTPLSYRAWNPQYVGPSEGPRIPETHCGSGLALVPTRAQMTLMVDNCTLSDHVADSMGTPVASGGIRGHSGSPGNLGQGPWPVAGGQERFQTLSTSQVPVALRTGTWPPAARPKCCGDRHCTLPTPGLRQEKGYTARVLELPPSPVREGAQAALWPSPRPPGCAQPPVTQLSALKLTVPLVGSVEVIRSKLPLERDAVPDTKAGAAGVALRFSKHFRDCHPVRDTAVPCGPLKGVASRGRCCPPRRGEKGAWGPTMPRGSG